MDERLRKTIAAIRASGADWAILASPDGVAYASGHVVPIEAGPSPFAGGPSLAMIGPDGQCGLVVANLEAGAANWAEEVVSYEGFSYREPTDVFANYVSAATALAGRLGLGGRIAIERHAFPHALAFLIEGRESVDIEPSFRRERAIKTDEEIALLRKAAHAASSGQRAFHAARLAGRSELDAFAEIRLAIETAAGARVPLTGDFISGRERTATVMGWPGSRIIGSGDPVICDLAPRVAGYWGDSCASAMVGTPTPAYRRLFETAKSALDLALEIARPGLVIGEFDQRLQAVVAAGGYRYAHHSGHSIGTSVHEWPRLVAYETAPLAEGMVVMVEPHAIDPEVGGVRVEFMLHITADGCEVLTDFEHHPSLPL